ncbi:MAG: multiple sugar transport system permease protein [Candidatus Atribacteria bacterium]|nr:multiple sugar transport system permease protein [Candidatus Atribacteria bacterium]
MVRSPKKRKGFCLGSGKGNSLISSFEKKRNVILLLLLPSMVLIFGLLIYPLIYSFYISLLDFNLTRPGVTPFIGLNNYIQALSDGFFLSSLLRTIYFAGVTVSVEIVLGLAVALLLKQKFRGRGLVRGLVILPWALPTVVNGIMWKWIYNANYGALNALLSGMGLIDSYQLWLGEPMRALHSVMFANIWKETPVGVLMILAVLEGISEELYEAARVDGANTWQRFRYITLPLIKPMIGVLFVIKIVWAIREFDLIYIVTRGGPAGGTTVLSYLAYLNGFKFFKMGYASAISYFIIVLAMIIGIPYIISIARSQKEVV